MRAYSNGVLFILWLFIRTANTDRGTYKQILKIIRKNRDLVGGTFYPVNTKIKELDTDALNCIYHIKGNKRSVFTKCSKKSACFQLYYSVYVNGKWEGKLMHQGCWMDTFLKSHNQNCSMEQCNDFNTKVYGHAFCCCTSSMCNSDMKMRYQYTTSSSVGHHDTLIPTVDPFERSTLILTAITTSVTLVFVIICLILSYYCRQKQQPKLGSTNSSVKKTLYFNDPLSDYANHQVMSYQVLNDILHGNIIHQGCQSAVRLGTYEGNTVAIKLVPPSGKKQWYNEKHTYTLLANHINIAQFVTSDILHQGHCFEGIIVMKYYQQGSLLNYLRQHTLSVIELLKLAYSITNGLAYLHGDNPQKTDGSSSRFSGVAHRDLNSRNILIQSNGTCVLADFGYAVDLSQPPFSESYQMIGSPRYMAPEVLERAPIGSEWSSALKQVDSYSLGLVLWELTRRCIIFNRDGKVDNCKLPYQEELGNQPSVQKVYHHVCSKRMRPVIFQANSSNESIHATFKRTMEECWDDDGCARLSALCVLNRLHELYQTLYPHDTPINKLIELPSQQVTEEVCMEDRDRVDDSSSTDDICDMDYDKLELLNACAV